MEFKEELIVEPSSSFEMPHESHYERSRSMWKELKQHPPEEEWFLCIDCQPYKILFESDGSIDQHCNDFKDHYRMYPAWWYLRFSLDVPDIAKSKKYEKFFKNL